MEKNKGYPTTAYIKELYKKYLPIYDGEKQKGLFLLPLQTGSGKTHATAQIIADIILNYEDVNVVYIIHNKTNREDIKSKILDLAIDDYQKELFNNEVFILESNEDRLRFFFEKNLDKNFKYINKFEEFKKLKKQIYTHCMKLMTVL